MRLAHTADFHIGAAGNRLDENGLNSALADRVRCAQFVIEDALTRGAQLILHGGDVFQGPRPTPTERRLALDAFAPALAAGVPVVICLGNHDMPRSVTEKHALDLLRDTDGLVVIDRPSMVGVWAHQGGPAVLGVRELATEPIDDLLPAGIVLQVAVMPYPSKQFLLRDSDNRVLAPADLNLLLRDRVMDCLRGLAAQRVEGVPAVLLIHAAFDTAKAGAQNSLAMLSSEWTVNVHDVAGLGFGAVLAGHYHRAQVIHEDPWIGYSGSPESCSFGEEADGGKGYYLHEIGGNHAI